MSTQLLTNPTAKPPEPPPPEPPRITEEEAALQKAEAEAEEKDERIKALEDEVAALKAEAKAKPKARPNGSTNENKSAKQSAWQTFEASAYTADCPEGCSGITSTGLDVTGTIYHAGKRIIAVDPSVIALGSTVEIKQADGTTFKAVASDVGGAMERIRPDVERLIRRELGKMTETNAKIHVLADETLGGIKREYVEVDRKAEVGEKIVIVDKMYPDDIYKEGDIFTVDRDFYSEYSFVESDGVVSDTNSSGIVYHVEYHVLEPTDIVHIDGGRYELADRKAEVGEKVIYNGNIATVKSVSGGFAKVEEYEDAKGDVIGGFSHGLYRVLVPVESAEADEPQPADLIDVVSNLATRVADLERKDAAKDDLINKALSDVYTRIGRLHDEIDTLHKDNRTLGEELEKAQKDLRETMDDVSCMDEEIKRAGSDINEMSFAVEDLAEALKKTDPVYGERIFTAEEVVAVMTALKVRP